ncbi:putative small monomeric GTPase [Helianthus annuus]|nr:translocase of chloroplast 120, chloroplastic [Helianthus annuus]XP_021972365.1 translocase of chloroplast 120, chloroplastic [Helianthus annuus]KAF5754653.1 putative small monomeric GTPase [Helianthus annuus]KAJ0635653.1 putative small monomeric GTPase [Helianthus annuus]
MENGVSKVEQVKLEVEEFDKDVFEGINGGVENGGDSGVSLRLDGETEKLEDASEGSSESQTVSENIDIDRVEEVVPVKVADGESTYGNTNGDQPVIKESNEFVDCDESDEKMLNMADGSEERNASENTAGKQPSGSEAYEAVNNDSSKERNASDDTARKQPSGFEANVAVNDDSSEEKGINVLQVIDGESTSDDTAKDQASELETDASVIGEKEEAKTVDVIDEQNMTNEIIDNGVNEVQTVSNADVSENVHEVSEKPATVILESSENGVSNHVDPDETVVHEDGVNGDSVSLETQPDGEIGVEANRDMNENDNLVAENKDVPTAEQVQEGEPKSFDLSSRNQNEKITEEESTSVINDEKSEPIEHEVKQDTPVKKEPEPRSVIGVSLSTPKSTTPTPVPNLKPDSKPTTALIPTPSSSTAPTRPAGLGRGAPLLEPAHRVVQSQPNGNGNASLQNQVVDEPTIGEPDENDDTREKLQMIRVKFLRLARRLGQTPHNVVVAQVLYRLGLAEQIRGSNGGRVAAFSFERASAMAEQLEAAGQEPLEFSCTIMVLGKTGVGKSSTINSIFDEVKFGTDAFQVGTRKVQDVVGTVQGIKVRVIDTPGLLSSWADQRKNEKILHSVKRFIQKSPPDIVLYLDRLDMQTRDFGDMPLLRTITDIFGQSIWFNAIVVLTHAASAPPEGPNGTATSYDMFVTQRSHVVQQAIRQAAGDMRLMNPVSLVENHSACRTNRAGQRVLPNGQVWKPHLLLLSFASKILVEANMLLKLQDSPPGKPFAARTRAPPLPYILSNLLQSRPQLKLPHEQFGDDDDGDDMDESSDEESSEYDELPPFKRLTNSQLSKLSKAQKKSYYDELEYREKLFMKKQLHEEKKQRKMMKKMAEAAKDFPTDLTDNVEEDSNGSATVPVAAQDMNLPASFDADNPTHRYRALESANQWLIRPVLDPHGWDHDVGYEGINVEHLLAVKQKIPISFSGQITKDKKDANLQMEVSSALKHGKSKSTTLALDMQTVGKEMSYTLRSDTRFINYRKNKASVGFSATYMGDSLTGGVKFEDKLTINKRGQLVVAGGAVIGRGDVAYGGSLEATLRDKDYPLGRFLSTIGLSVMDWHGDLALGWNAQSQIPIGRSTNLIGRFNLNNKGSGQVSVRLNSSEQLQIALAAFVPLVSKLLGYYQDRDSAY